MPTTASTSPVPDASAETTAAVNEYLTAFYRGDFDRAAAVVADGFCFEGPFLQVTGKDAFFAGAQGLRQVVRGHRLVRQWADGNEVSSLYEVDLATQAGQGSVLMSEWHKVDAGQITSGRVVFDTAAFRALLPVPSDAQGTAHL